MQRLTPTTDQYQAIKTIARTTSGAALCTAGLGAGKTLTAVEVVRERDPRTVVVVCPLGTRVGWEQTFKRQGIDLPVHRVDSTKRGKEALASLLADEAGVYLIGREYVRRLPTEKMRPDMCIVDEVHFMQNKDSVSFKKMMRMKAGFRLGLSGTPFRNKFEGAWAVTRWLWPTEVDRSFWRWAVQWCRTIYDVWSYNNKKIVGERVPGAYVAQLPCYVQFETKVGEAVTEYRYVDLTPAQRKMYEQMEANGLAWLKENPLVADLPIVQRVRLRQMTLGTVTFAEDGSIGFEDDCKSSKIDALKEILADLEGEPVLILTDSQRFAEVVTKRLGAKAREWSGNVTTKSREELLRTFAKDYQYLVATISSIAEGVDGLQHECANVVWLSKSEDNTMNSQALGRLVRTGQTRQVTSYEIVANDTYDVGILSRLVEQELEMRRVLRVEK